MINRTPEILIIHLKRFVKKVIGRSMRFVKNGDRIDYPISEWDISQFCLPKAKGTKYELNGVVVHYGRMGGGHYTAMARNFQKKRWVNFDDSDVNYITNQNQIVTRNAYVLFYQRIK